jgi:hypothetical protein
MWSAMTRRSAGFTDFTPSMPAVFLPRLSCVTLRTARSLADWDAHQQFLEFVDCSGLATLTRSEDALLDA